MTENSLSLEEKQQRYDEFFTIKQNFQVNILPLTDEVPSYQEFVKQIPLPFQIASDVATLDQSALRPLRQLDNVTESLVDVINIQTQKINLLVNYILANHDLSQYRQQGSEFGGGGIKFHTTSTFELGQFVEIKLFFEHEHCAIYAIGEVIEIDSDNQEIKAIFHLIRDEDREIVVRASLHEQTKQLHALAEKRRQEKSE